MTKQKNPALHDGDGEPGAESSTFPDLPDGSDTGQDAPTDVEAFDYQQAVRDCIAAIEQLNIISAVLPEFRTSAQDAQAQLHLIYAAKYFCQVADSCHIKMSFGEKKQRYETAVQDYLEFMEKVRKIRAQIKATFEPIEL